MYLNYCYEQKPYFIDSLSEIFNISEHNKLRNIISELESKKIIDCKDGTFSFEYVGVIILQEAVIFVLPKYLTSGNVEFHIKQLLCLLKEYNYRENLDKEEIDTLGSIQSDEKNNLLSVIIFLVSDYFENGLYSNDLLTYIFNGDDDIEWVRTIEEVNPIINKGNPVYLDYYTYSNQNDDEDYFRKIHKFVLTRCTEKLKELFLSEYFGFQPISFNVGIESIGNPYSILSRIDLELNVQFVYRKQLVLKAMASFISQDSMEKDLNTIGFYGTRTFNLVWEKTCSYVLNNQHDSLKKFIAKPLWKTITGFDHQGSALRPDILSVINDSKDNIIIISDAKYYNIILNDETLSGNPGVGDVTKQYLYQLALNEYISANKFEYIYNTFLFPSEESDIEIIGSVTVGFLKNLGLEDIQLIKMPAHLVFDLYIKSKKINYISFLDFINTQRF